MNRRQLLASAVLLVPALLRAPSALANFAAGTTREGVEALRTQWKKYLAGNADIATDPSPITLTDAQWKKRLTPAAYDVLRHEGTEYPGSSPLNAEKRDGIFACAGCALPLFTSAMKFESGTGWPSFVTSIPGAFATTTDHKLIYARTEYHCSKCGGHHGHVFDDGPQPLGERWCSNGVALRFIPRA
jgi:peptide-methionine (R)-S-oxide reductase